MAHFGHFWAIFDLGMHQIGVFCSKITRGTHFSPSRWPKMSFWPRKIHFWTFLGIFNFSIFFDFFSIFSSKMIFMGQKHVLGPRDGQKWLLSVILLQKTPIWCIPRSKLAQKWSKWAILGLFSAKIGFFWVKNSFWALGMVKNEFLAWFYYKKHLSGAYQGQK